MTKQATPIFGLNLGGWLLVERWMTPSVFKGHEVEDEYGLSSSPEGKARIADHRKTFMSEEDWRWLHKRHITFVRLPIGYWALSDDDPYMNVEKELDWAFEMAEKYHIQILLDLHGLKGSQNGTIHSGHVGKVLWEKYVTEHLDVLKTLADRYGKSPALWGIEIINEPKVLGHYWSLRSFYQRAYELLRRELRPGTRIVFQDGFAPLLFSGAIRATKSHPVVMDTHFYLIGDRMLGLLSPKAYDFIRGCLYRAVLFVCRFQQPVIVGEWSSVLPQRMFNRVPQSEHGAMLAATIRRQKKIYASATATRYWNYKAEGRGMYHYRSLVEDGLI